MIKYHTLLIERWWKINSWQHLNCPSVFFHQMKNSPSQDSNPGPRKWFSGHSFEAMYHFISSGIKIFFLPKAKKSLFSLQREVWVCLQLENRREGHSGFLPVSLSLSLSLVRTHTHSFSNTLCGAHTRSLARTVHSHSLHLFSSSFRASLFDSRSIFVSKLNNKFCISCLFLFLFAMKKKKNFWIKKFRSNKKKKLVLRKVKHALMFKNQGGRQVWWQKKFGVITKLGRFAVI